MADREERDEAMLRVGDEAFRLLVENVRDYAILMLDPAGRIVSWNAGAERLTGYSAQEILGVHFSVFYSEEDRQRGHPEEELRIAAAEGRYEEERWRVRKDGSQFWANVVVTTLRDDAGNIRGFAKITRDFSDRRKTETALRHSEARLRLLVDSIKEHAIVMLDPEGRVSSWNAGAQRIKGYAAEEIVGRYFSVFFTEEDRASGKPELELELALRQGTARDEGWRVRKDGSRFWADVTVSCVSADDGTHLGFAKVTRDRTEKREADEAIRRLNQDLERRVAERTAALTSANQELEAFSYSVAHDLRSPLRSIDGFSQALLEDCADKLDAEGKQYLDYIRESAQQMARLIDDLLTLSRVTRSELRKERVDLSALARAALARLRKADPARRVEAVVGEGLTAVGDARLLGVVLDNLLGNAWKFTGKRPVACIEIGVEDQGGERAFFVRDNGAGFDMTYAQKLFGVFQRLHPASEFEGTGIGLATVHRIVRRHGGRVWAEGSLDRGATFFFTLGLELDAEER